MGINSSFSTFGLKTAAAALAVAATFGTVSTVQAKTEEGFRAAVEKSIDKELRKSNYSSHRGVATLAVTLDGSGEVLAVDVVQSTGYSSLDREAIRTAKQTAYPATGDTRTVAMVLGFNQQVKAQHKTDGRKLVASWIADNRVMLANRTTAQQPDS